MTKLPVIIINYKQPQNTLECLASLAESSHAQDLIPIIVDAGSALQGGTLKKRIEESYDSWVHFVPLAKNLGFSGANNVGIKYALKEFSPEYIAILNDDTTVHKNLFSELLKFLEEHPRAGAAAPKIYFTPGQEFHSGYHKDEIGKVFWYAGGVIDWTEVVGFHQGVDEVDHGQYDKPQETEFLTGCCTVFRSQALKQSKLFDQKYFLYLEDLDLSLRLQKKGWQTWYVPQAVMWHKNAGSSSSGSSLHQYYFTRNRYLFGNRFAPLRTKLFLLRLFSVQWRQGDEITRLALKDTLIHRYGQRKQLHQ